MKIAVRVVRRETHRAVQLILAERPYRIVWAPKSQIAGEVRAGERDIVIEVTDWIVKQWENDV